MFPEIANRMEVPVPPTLPCLVCPEDAVDMQQEKCHNCGEFVSCIAKAWRDDAAGQRENVAAETAADAGRQKAVDVKRLLGELEDFRAAKKTKGEARPLSCSLAPLEGAACPWHDMHGCKGVIVVTYRLSSDHVYLRCSNNDPKRLSNKRDAQCSWSFNSLREADPDFAALVLRRRDQENGAPK